MLFRVLHHLMDAETNRIPPGKYKQDEFLSGDQVVGMQKPAHHQEYCSDSCGDCVQCPSYLYDCFADLTACKLIISLFMSAVACRPVTPRLWSAVNDACCS